MKLIARLFFAAAAASPFYVFVAVAQPAPAVTAAVVSSQPNLAKGAATFAAVCAACHGADGNSPLTMYPHLAQQHPEYLVKQLREFKSDQRSNAVMKGFATSLSEQDMKDIAFWVTTQKVQPGFAQDITSVALGERIYRGGIADRQIPACAGCHSPNGAGIPAQYPRLGGQHAQYTAAQLVAFRDGVRKNSLQMTQIAAKLNDREIKAVADYIAGLR